VGIAGQHRLIIHALGLAVLLGVDLLGDILGVLPELLEVPDPHNIAALQRPVVLGAHQQVALVGVAGLGGANPGGVGAAQGVGVEADTLGYLAAGAAAVAQGNDDRSVGLAGHDPDRHAQGAPTMLDIDHAAVGLGQLLKLN